MILTHCVCCHPSEDAVLTQPLCGSVKRILCAPTKGVLPSAHLKGVGFCCAWVGGTKVVVPPFVEKTGRRLPDVAARPRARPAR